MAEQPHFSTVNDAEIAHFSRLSALWWDERGEFALLHKMNAHRMRFIREKLQLDPLSARISEPSRVLTGLDVLDVGCGGGILSEASFYHFFLPFAYTLVDTHARPTRLESCTSRRQHARRRRVRREHRRRVAPRRSGPVPR